MVLHEAAQRGHVGHRAEHPVLCESGLSSAQSAQQ
jgi:hypothetical protein